MKNVLAARGLVGSVTVFSAENKACRLSLVNHSAKTIHQFISSSSGFSNKELNFKKNISKRKLNLEIMNKLKKFKKQRNYNAKNISYKEYDSKYNFTKFTTK